MENNMENNMETGACAAYLWQVGIEEMEKKWKLIVRASVV